jgi:hypothetical protein
MKLVITLLTLAALSACVTSGQVKDRGERPVGADRKGAN